MQEGFHLGVDGEQRASVQGLKELKKSRRTVMLGSALTLSNSDNTLCPPLTPPLSERASGDVEPLFSPVVEEHYESVDFSSEDEEEDVGMTQWNHGQPTPAEEFDEPAELIERNPSEINGKRTITSLRHILSQTPDKPLPPVSSLPSPPPMTIMDFWTNVVRNYNLVHRTMPMFLFNKIRDGGVPPPLRRVVWFAMAGVTNEYATEMASIYSRLEVGGIGGWDKDIGRDLHRTWPEVDMFKEEDGLGQRGLKGVLEGYSVWDNAVGYCQGLGFLVGPLLMQTSSPAEAFILLTVLMSQPSNSPSKQHSSIGYSLRTLYTPNFPGLLSLVYAFDSILSEHLPSLSSHLTSLGVTTEMYVPQWFLSMFAVTGAPIDSILLRIWDLLMMEGSNGGHTMIRIGLAVMKLQQDSLLCFGEMEDCLKLLLSKAPWETINADALIGLAGGDFKVAITADKLSELDKEYNARQSKSAERRELQSVAGRFLGRLRQNVTQLSVDTTNLVAPPMLRTLSKASFTASPQEMEPQSSTSSAGMLRAPSELSRSPSAASFRAGTSDGERVLHAQIEELVSALGDVQRKVGEKENEKDVLKTENMRLREMLSKVSIAMGTTSSVSTPPNDQQVEQLHIPQQPEGSENLSSLSDEISEILSSSKSPATSPTSCSGSILEEENMRTQLTETQHLLNQERQANMLLQEQLSTTEIELARTRSALFELRSKMDDEPRRQRQPSQQHSSRAPSSTSLRELKLVVSATAPPNPTSSASSNSAGSTWSSWLGRR